MFKMSSAPAATQAVSHLRHSLIALSITSWSRRSHWPIPPRHAGAALPRPWSGGACTHALVGSPTLRSRRGSYPDCSAATARADFFWNTNILNFQISQGNAATQLRWGGSLYNRSIQNFLRNLTVKELWKSVFICRSYDHTTKWLFFGTRCRKS